MAVAIPESLKSIKRFIIQANTVEKSNQPVIAYYLRVFACSTALKTPNQQRDATTRAYLGFLMDQLEKARGDLTIDKINDKAIVETFASTIFNYADKIDREGKADKNTILAFLTASVVFECLEYFDALNPEIEEKIVYAKWKAADISKCLKSGSKPIAGPYAPEDIKERPISDFKIQPIETSFDDDEVDFRETNSRPLSNSHAIDSPVEKPPELANNNFSSNFPGPTISAAPAQMDLQREYYTTITEAEKKTSQALSSMRFKDWVAADRLLLEALERIRRLQQWSGARP